ncbi:hypothetical protein ACLKA6_017962 [Drosophila palustris]
MKKLKARRALPYLEAEKMDNIVNTLFPTHQVRSSARSSEATSVTPVELFTENELVIAAKSLKNGKTPGPDSIPAEVLKAIVESRPRKLLEMYNACIRTGTFPEPWKVQRLVLISKGKGDPETASAYRPLCMLDTAGKLLEKLIKPRLAAAVENAGGLSSRQFGFRPGRSTIGAIQEVTKAALASHQGNHHSRPIVLLATLDVKNAFNSVRWAEMIEALQNRFQTPEYLMRIIDSYLENRKLVYPTTAGEKCIQVTAGAAQGSILGRDLWNIAYDEVLRIDMPDDTFLVGYADDIAAVITARNTDYAQRKLTQVMIRVNNWLDSRGLKLATEKTELLLITRRQIPTEVDMRLNESFIRTQKAIKYLGLRIDSKLTFQAQINHAITKSSTAIRSLSRLMANVGGPVQSRRKLLMEINNAILLYGCEIWADALTTKYRANQLLAMQRTSALRIISAYRTVSGATAMVIAGVVPIDLLAQERKQIYELRQAREATRQRVNMCKQNTLDTWQSRWAEESTGRWTARLLPNINAWMHRRHGDVDYYVTQMLTGHGYFSSFLHSIGKSRERSCVYGDAERDNVEHTIFHCERFKEERLRLTRTIGEISPDNIITIMISSDENWRHAAAFIGDILRKKKKDLDDRR